MYIMDQFYLKKFNKKCKNAQLSDGQSLAFLGFFFIFLIAGRNHATLKCKSGALGVTEARS